MSTMENGYSKGTENIYFQCRKRAAQYNESLSSREKAAEMLGISTSSLANYELGVTKTVPVDVVVMMADLYNAPELRNLYCKNECPIGRALPMATETKGLESITLKLLKSLDDDLVKGMKKDLIEIAEDGKVTEDEQERFEKVMEWLTGIEEKISELKIIAEKHRKK